MTGQVDSLDADGWVTRRPHPTDRRATAIGLTPSAKEKHKKLAIGYLHFAAMLLGAIPGERLDKTIAGPQGELDRGTKAASGRARGVKRSCFGLRRPAGHRRARGGKDCRNHVQKVLPSESPNAQASTAWWLSIGNPGAHDDGP